jgi:protocadherin Fat 1/2/3
MALSLALTGLIYIVNRLDYEVRSKYELLVRATDSVSGAHSEVPVSVSVEDANDSPPEFSNNEYNVTLSEATPSGTVVLAVSAHDLDSGNIPNDKNKPREKHTH